jgi:hypothetical protein
MTVAMTDTDQLWTEDCVAEAMKYFENERVTYFLPKIFKTYSDYSEIPLNIINRHMKEWDEFVKEKIDSLRIELAEIVAKRKS